MSLERFTAYHDLRLALGNAITVMCQHWATNAADSAYDEWELEIRLGELLRHAPPPPGSHSRAQKQHHVQVVDRGVRFEAHVPDRTFLALFHLLCAEACVRKHTVGASVYTTVDRDAVKRTVHTETHVCCFEHTKLALQENVDFERDIAGCSTWAFDLRIATNVETTPVPIQCRGGDKHGDTVRRQRRTITLDVAPWWHIDFTRLDDGRVHQVEIELTWPYAYTSALRAYNALAVKPDEFSAYFVHCAVEQFISAIEHLNKLCLKL